MTVITDTKTLNAFIDRARSADFITVDTEFLREKTYWPKLCLVQVATDDEAVAIDPLADGIDLYQLYDLLADENILKVVHSGRQDLEIFWHEGGIIPKPLFDSQIAAMVCGYGDSVGYETLVRKITKQKIDKSSRFSDWTNRPLTAKQIAYALSDVTHLRDIYRSLSKALDENNRTEWMQEELSILMNPRTYNADSSLSWKRLKYRPRNMKEQTRLERLASWREETAKSQNVPRGRVVRDDALGAIISANPSTYNELMSQRGIKGNLPSKYANMILEELEAVNQLSEDQLSPLPSRKQAPDNQVPATDLIRVALKQVADELGVASRLIANSDDLDSFVRNQDIHSLPMMNGWRYKVFGEVAEDILNGRLGLSMKDGQVDFVKLS